MVAGVDDGDPNDLAEAGGMLEAEMSLNIDALRQYYEKVHSE